MRGQYYEQEPLANIIIIRPGGNFSNGPNSCPFVLRRCARGPCSRVGTSASRFGRSSRDGWSFTPRTEIGNLSTIKMYKGRTYTYAVDSVRFGMFGVIGGAEERIPSVVDCKQSFKNPFFFFFCRECPGLKKKISRSANRFNNTESKTIRIARVYRRRAACTRRRYPGSKPENDLKIIITASLKCFFFEI